MAEITIGMIKELRESTGCGIRRCKRLLTLAEGDMDIAVDLARYDGYAVSFKDREGNKLDYPEAMAKKLLSEKRMKESKKGESVEKMEKCMICGNEFLREDMRMCAQIPVWLDMAVDGEEEPFSTIVETNVCGNCFDSIVLLHSTGRDDSLLQFRPFPTFAPMGSFIRQRSRMIANQCKNQSGFNESWWREIVSDENGNLDPVKVMNELHDLNMLISNISMVYDDITDGNISKPNTSPWVVSSYVNDMIEKRVDEAIEEKRQEVMDVFSQ